MKKTLAEVPSNKIVKVVDFKGYGKAHLPNFVIRLQEMGILKGEEILVERNTGFGPIAVKVKGTSLAIGRGIASKIVVEEVN